MGDRKRVTRRSLDHATEWMLTVLYELRNVRQITDDRIEVHVLVDGISERELCVKRDDKPAPS